MSRSFYSGSFPCRSACGYCFAKFTNYRAFSKWPSGLNTPAEIVYPCCDSEFARSPEFILSLEELADRDGQTIISLSTKNSLSPAFLDRLKCLDNKMRHKRAGFIKVGVSFTTKKRVAEIEPHTASYEERIAVLEKLVERNLVSSINFKPILPFIPSIEYFEIVSDTKRLGVPYLIGGLYLDVNSHFYKSYIDGKYSVRMKHVDWLSEKVQWPYVEDVDQLLAIRSYIGANDGHVFESDPDLLESLQPQEIWI